MCDVLWVCFVYCIDNWVLQTIFLGLIASKVGVWNLFMDSLKVITYYHHASFVERPTQLDY